MERLTYWSKKNEQYEIYTDGVIHCGSITDRLAEYEDTGLTPEEIKELEQNYRDGEYEFCGEYGTDNCQFQYKLEKLQKDRDYWKAEALKHCAKLGEIKLLAGR